MIARDVKRELNKNMCHFFDSDLLSFTLSENKRSLFQYFYFSLTLSCSQMNVLK